MTYASIWCWGRRLLSFSAVAAGLQAAFAGRASAQAGVPDSVVHRRLQDVAALVCANPGPFDSVFAPGFLSAISTEHLKAVFVALAASGGHVANVVPLDPKVFDRGNSALEFVDGSAAPVEIALEPHPPWRVRSLWIGGVQRTERTLSVLASVLGRLPGRTSFFIGRLEQGGSLTTIAAYAPDRPLAVASAFKLYVLSALASEVNAGHRTLADVVRLEPEDRSLPSGVLQDWPTASALTLHTAANLMVSLSDNTATDLLIRVLGKPRVLTELRRCGNRSLEANTPLLTTAEYFRLLAADGGATALRYIKAPDQRDSILAALGRDPLPAPALVPAADPTLAGWTASSSDLGRALACIAARPGAPGSDAAMQALAIHAGPWLDRGRWAYAGYKGGSIRGVFSYAALLQGQSGARYVLSFVWNGAPEDVTDLRAAPILIRAGSLLAEEASH